MSVLGPGQSICIAAVALGGWVVAAPAQAQSQSDQETVVVTGSHLPQAVGQDAFSVVKLGEQQLDQFDQIDAGLEEVPGVSLFRRTTSLSANPTTQGISLRAIAPSAASRALVLLDGVPLNDPFGGWVIWSGLPQEDVAAAEIVRGAGSGPYGSGALTGTILLSERDDVDGVSQADASGGNLDTFRVGGSGGTTVGPVSLFASGAAEHSNGWIPVEPDVQGPADNHVRLNAMSGSVRAQSDLGNATTASLRLGAYDELQGAGLVGAEATAKGETASLTIAHSGAPGGVGWRLQGWVIDSDLSNTSVATANSLAHPQASTTPSNDQYSTPALGWGMNAAALGKTGVFRWEAGADIRDDQGQSKEFYSYSSGHYTDARRSGGQSLIAGLYGEGAADLGPWLLTAGGRLDYWATSQGHLVQNVIATDASLGHQVYTGRDGAVPTGRAGLKRDLGNGEYLRVAAYAGFRVPTLNELYRPFRVGNVVTNANAALVPEKLNGFEIGWGGSKGFLSWNATGFWNQLHNAIENATIATSNCPAGTAAGNCQQRENVGNIDAVGLEADISEALTPTLSLRQALSWTDARVQPGSAAPLLAGKRPAEAPGAVATAGAHWQPLKPLSLDADLRWVSSQFDNDLNTIKLGSALTVDVRAAWLVGYHVSVFGRVDNLLDANVATGNTTGVINIGQPRTFEIGVTYAD